MEGFKFKNIIYILSICLLVIVLCTFDRNIKDTKILANNDVDDIQTANYTTNIEFIPETKEEELKNLTLTTEPYLNESFEIINNINELDIEKELKVDIVDDIKQVFYKKYNDENTYIYIEIDNKKYHVDIVGGFICLPNEQENFSKTDIKLDYPIYKITYSVGATVNNCLYIKIVDNVPVLIYKTENAEEFICDGEVLTYKHGGGSLPPSYTLCFWTETGVDSCYLNEYFDAYYISFDFKTHIIEVGKLTDNNVENLKKSWYKLVGEKKVQLIK